METLGSNKGIGWEREHGKARRLALLALYDDPVIKREKANSIPHSPVRRRIECSNLFCRLLFQYLETCRNAISSHLPCLSFRLHCVNYYSTLRLFYLFIFFVLLNKKKQEGEKETAHPNILHHRGPFSYSPFPSFLFIATETVNIFLHCNVRSISLRTCAPRDIVVIQNEESLGHWTLDIECRGIRTWCRD